MFSVNTPSDAHAGAKVAPSMPVTLKHADGDSGVAENDTATVELLPWKPK